TAPEGPAQRRPPRRRRLPCRARARATTGQPRPVNFPDAGLQLLLRPSSVDSIHYHHNDCVNIAIRMIGEPDWPRQVEFFFAFLSPYSYLATTQLPHIRSETGAEI